MLCARRRRHDRPLRAHRRRRPRRDQLGSRTLRRGEVAFASVSAEHERLERQHQGLTPPSHLPSCHLTPRRSRPGRGSAQAVRDPKNGRPVPLKRATTSPRNHSGGAGNSSRFRNSSPHGDCSKRWLAESNREMASILNWSCPSSVSPTPVSRSGRRPASNAMRREQPFSRITRRTRWRLTNWGRAKVLHPAGRGATNKRALAWSLRDLLWPRGRQRGLPS